jgi:hypothetical protein
MGFIKYLLTGGATQKTVGEDYPLPTTQGALDSAIDDITAHFARGAAVLLMNAVNADTTSAAITVPAWANAIIVHARTAVAGDDIQFSVLGSMDDTNYGLCYQTGTTTAMQFTITAVSSQTHAYTGLPTKIKIDANDVAGWNTTTAYVYYQFATV